MLLHDVEVDRQIDVYLSVASTLCERYVDIPLHRRLQKKSLQEGIIRKLNKHLGLKPTPVDGEIGETVWSMLHGDSSLTANETANLVINRFQVQEVGSNLGEVADILDDCFLPGDQEKILRAVASKNKESQIATEVRATCMSTYKAVLNALPADVKKRGEAERKKKEAAEAKEQKTMQREINRSYDKVNENVEKVWKTVLPPKAKAYTDEYNGRWRLSYITNGPTCQRSISWSTKGSKKAAGEACMGSVDLTGMSLKAYISSYFYHIGTLHPNPNKNLSLKHRRVGCRLSGLASGMGMGSSL